MIHLLRIGTGLAVVLAIVSANLWLELRSERTLTADLRTRLVESTIRVSSAESTPTVEARTEPAALTRAIRDPETTPPKPEAPRPAPASAATYTLERDLMQDSGFRNARLIQTRMTLKRTYTEVAEEVGLTEGETERLFDLLAEQQIGPNRSADAITALLGPGRQKAWQDYQLTLSARNRASQMSGMLASSGYPLTEEQLKPLRTALIAEEKYVRDQDHQKFSQMPPGTPVERAQLLAQQTTESIDRQEQSNRRYLQAAAPYMSPKQLELVKDTLEQQIAMSRATARMQAERSMNRALGTNPQASGSEF